MLRNSPPDLMFELTQEEFANLRSQFATSSLIAKNHGGRRYAPRVFTEHGALMAAMVLNSPRAVQVSLYVVRAFVRLREAALKDKGFAQQLAELQDKTESLAMSHETFSRNTRNQLKQVFDTLRELMTPPEPHKRPIGFVHPKEGKEAKDAVKSKAIKTSQSAKAVKAVSAVKGKAKKK